MNEAFKKVLKYGTLKSRMMKYLFLAIIAIGIIISLVEFISTGSTKSFPMLISMTLVFGIIFLVNRHKFKEVGFWINIFENKPKEILWIKPIVTEHKTMLVFTVVSSRQFEIYLKNGVHMKFEVTERRISDFYDGIKEHAPHAHFGYSKEVKKLYNKERALFLDRAKKLGHYNSINDFTL